MGLILGNITMCMLMLDIVILLFLAQHLITFVDFLLYRSSIYSCTV